MANTEMTIEIVYARVNQQKLLAVTVPTNSTIEEAINQSAILELFPEINLAKQKVGIFGKLKELTTVLKPGDRIEIYRPLVLDPKEARRRRAKK